MLPPCSQMESGASENAQIAPNEPTTLYWTIDDLNGYKSTWGPASLPMLTRETFSVVGFSTPELAELLVGRNPAPESFTLVHQLD
jgi:hypothetical protein